MIKFIKIGDEAFQKSTIKHIYRKWLDVIRIEFIDGGNASIDFESTIKCDAEYHRALNDLLEQE